MTDSAAIDATVQIHVNGEPRRVPAMTVAQWIEQERLAPETVATAINGEFMPRAARADRQLRDGDRLDVFRAIVGG